jgi:PhzF family phenazine biosynthesis protein
VKIDIFQVDAFANNMFSGITSAVCPLDKWLDNSLMQQIAEKTNLSKTAFIVKLEADVYEVRWFTPKNEVTLSDHTPLASAYVIFNYLEKDISQVTLHSIAGDIVISKKDNLLSLNFQANMPELYNESNPIFSLSTGIEPLKVLKHTDYILVFENEEIIKNLNPKIQVLKSLDLRGVCFTALGKDNDFVFKYFAPKLGVDEDLVTGSVCSQLVPYWSQVLNKTSLSAAQFSNKRGKILCQLNDDIVTIQGEASLFMKGEIIIEERRFSRDKDPEVKRKLAIAI